MKPMPNDSYVPNVLYNTNVINISNPAKGICICTVTVGSGKLRAECLRFCRWPACPAEKAQL